MNKPTPTVGIESESSDSNPMYQNLTMPTTRINSEQVVQEYSSNLKSTASLTDQTKRIDIQTVAKDIDEGIVIARRFILSKSGGNVR